ncbi:C-reactive protein-like [Talpa occidentalis]|uniref:C-reactive protein-like n=1 Tax=Talpa occidentalis TaxID=50954 RepID=UPI0023FA179D|nr:C-reactive protein-like [Talpa occidentalis]
MYGKVFVLPEESANSFVTLKAQAEKPLTAFTLCPRFCTDLPSTYGLFFYTTRKQTEDILLSRRGNGVYSVGVSGAQVSFRSPVHFPALEHVCASCHSASGIAELWVDGKPMVRRCLKKGYSIGTDASIILGQRQHSLGGAFDMQQSLVGDMEMCTCGTLCCRRKT